MVNRSGTSLYDQWWGLLQEVILRKQNIKTLLRRCNVCHVMRDDIEKDLSTISLIASSRSDVFNSIGFMRNAVAQLTVSSWGFYIYIGVYYVYLIK